MSPLPFRPPAQVVLAADARLTDTPPAEDHVWALHAAWGERDALALVTTYGLRVQSLALFPYVVAEGQPRWASPAFARRPQIHDLAPAYAHLTCEPFRGLLLRCEYWVAHPQAVIGRLTLENRAEKPREGLLGLAAVLRPFTEDEHGMTPRQRHAVHILQGEAGGLQPVVFLTGGAEAALSPFPSLKVAFGLPAGGSRSLTWVQTALADAEAGFELARKLAARSWPAFLARLALLESGRPRLETAAPARTWVFLRARQTAQRLLVRLPDLPQPFLLTARAPDHGGPADPRALNRAASVLDAYHLAATAFLPTAPRPVQGWVAAFLARQEDDGFIPWRPAQPESRRLASPLLVELAYRAYAHDPAGLAALYRPLLRFVEAWYAQSDANRDGFPEWSHPLQMGLPDLPGFAPWRRDSVGADLAQAESPALYAFLYRALERLEAFAAAAGEAPPPDLRLRRRRLRQAVAAMWDARRRAPLYRDYETHERPPHLTLGKHRGPGTLAVAETFALPGRVVVHLFPEGGQVASATITLRGSDARGKPLEETLGGGRIRWHEGRGVAVSRSVFRHLATVTVEGEKLRSRSRFVVLTPDYATPDISLLLPFWAEMLAEEAADAVRRALTSERDYARPYGAPLSPRGGQKAAAWRRAVHMPWNLFAVEGLLAHGFVADAARLLEALAAAAESALTAQGTFAEAYHADTGEAMGGRDALGGLPPLGLWLRTAGIEPLGPHKVRFAWPTPFKEEITASFWGWRIRRGPGRTLITTPDGETRTLTAPEPCEVEIV